MSKTKANTPNLFKMKISEELTKQLEDANAMAASLKAAVNQFMDSHALDPDDSAVTGPVAQAFIDKMSNAEKEYSRLKVKLSNTYFDPQRCQPNIIIWNLDFATGVVTINMKPGTEPVLIDGCGATFEKVEPEEQE